MEAGAYRAEGVKREGARGCRKRVKCLGRSVVGEGASGCRKRVTRAMERAWLVERRHERV